MLKLHGKLPVLNAANKDSYLLTVTKSANLPRVLRERKVLIRQSAKDGKGFKAILTKELQDNELCEVVNKSVEISCAASMVISRGLLRLNQLRLRVHRLNGRNDLRNLGIALHPLKPALAVEQHCP